MNDIRSQEKEFMKSYGELLLKLAQADERLHNFFVNKEELDIEEGNKILNDIQDILNDLAPITAFILAFPMERIIALAQSIHETLQMESDMPEEEKNAFRYYPLRWDIKETCTSKDELESLETLLKRRDKILKRIAQECTIERKIIKE